MNCPKGYHYSADAEACLGNLTPEQVVLCFVAGIGIFIAAKLFRRYCCRRN